MNLMAYIIKACKLCKAILGHEVNPCPICGYTEVKWQITIEEYLKNGKSNNDGYVPEAVKRDAEDMLKRVNSLLEALGYRGAVLSSGWRPASYNSLIGGAPNSHHVTGRAVDIVDNDRRLGQLILTNLKQLERFDLYIEDPHYTISPNKSRWIHIQSKPPKSKKRVYQPFPGPPPVIDNS